MAAQGLNKVLILVADDEVNLLTLLKDNLEEHGFEIITAVNGEEALQKSLAEKPDIIILDVEKSEIAKKLGVAQPGEYAVRVR